jgi:hypothetical protein
MTANKKYASDFQCGEKRARCFSGRKLRLLCGG